MVEEYSQSLASTKDSKDTVKSATLNGFDRLKQNILDDEVGVVSFDIFDTLVVRPFLVPSDMFFLLDKHFKDLEGQFRLQNFRDIRVESEVIARAAKRDGEDVSLGQIYDVMQREFSVKKHLAGKMLLKELEYEIRYCSQRKTAKELYDFAVHAGKKIIITSDMYLPVETLETILKNCGYKGYDKLYVSSHHGTMKATQNLYKHIVEDLNVTPGSVFHIGDNYESDVIAANRAGWKAMHFPKTTESWGDAFKIIFGDDTVYAQNHLGITVAYALAANIYFDNPYRDFNKDSVYNGSPYLVGYFALGVSLLGFTRWMIDDMKTKNLSSIVFLARDGYLPMRVFEMFMQVCEISTKVNYLPTSRKATIPLALFGQINVSDIKTFNHQGKMNDTIRAALKPYIEDGTENINYKKLDALRTAFVATYKSYFGKNVAVMDIGYSGRPEQILAHLFKTPLETYFMYTGSDEARRRLGKRVNIFSRLKVAGLREKMISEIGPSCIGYKLVGDHVEPIFEKEIGMSSHEKTLVSTIQNGAIDFVQAYLGNFGDHLDQMDLGDNQLAMRPLDQVTVTPARLDREIFHGIMHEDDIAGDSAIDLFNTYYGTVDKIDHTRLENNRLTAELQSHLGIKRSARLLAGNIKRRIVHGWKR